MRTIKFRGWDFGTEEMIAVDDIQFYNPEEIEIDGGIFMKPKAVQPTMINTKSAWRVVDGEDMVLMQYTGLKDKNGKEILEGDILHWETNKKDWIVFWSDTGARYVLNAVDDKEDVKLNETLIHVRTRWLEVVGNIYENKYMLT